MNIEKLINTLNDWISINPIFKKKFEVENIHEISPRFYEITTSTTTKSNLNTFKRYLPTFLTLENIGIFDYTISNLMDDIDIQTLLNKYFLSTGLKESEFTIESEKKGLKTSHFIVKIKVDIKRWLQLKNLYLNKDFIITYSDLFNTNLKNYFSLDVLVDKNFVNSFENLENQFQESLMSCYGYERYEKNKKKLNPTLGLRYVMPTHLEVFVNSLPMELGFVFRRDDFGNKLKNCYDRFFEDELKIGNGDYKGWSFYKRGEWINKNDLLVGSLE